MHKTDSFIAVLVNNECRNRVHYDWEVVDMCKFALGSTKPNTSIAQEPFKTCLPLTEFPLL